MMEQADGDEERDLKRMRTIMITFLLTHLTGLFHKIIM